MTYEQRIELKICNTTMTVIRRAASVAPIEGTVGLIDFGSRDRIEGQRVGLFRKGEWRSQHDATLSEQPSHWTSLFEDKIDVPA